MSLLDSILGVSENYVTGGEGERAWVPLCFTDLSRLIVFQINMP